MTLKRCSRGDDCVHPLGCWQPATKEYFGRRSTAKDGFRERCKVCIKKSNKRYRAENTEKIREYNQRYRAENAEKIREYHQRYRADHIEEAREYQRRYRVANIEKIHERQHRYYAANAEMLYGCHQRYRADHREEMREYYRRYRVANVERVREHQQRYRSKYPEKRRAYLRRRYIECPSIFKSNYHRYRTRKYELPNNFTATDWQQALDYFNGCCAVCGRQLKDLFATHTAAMDHWIPLTDPRPDNPGTVPTNIVPLCHGVGGCNNRKSNRDPVEFLEAEFGKRKAAQILKRINAYFASLTAQENAA